MGSKGYRVSDIVHRFLMFRKEDVYNLLAEFYREGCYESGYSSEELFFRDVFLHAAYNRIINRSRKCDPITYETYHLFDPIDELPLHINDPEPLGRLVAKWRLERGI